MKGWFASLAVLMSVVLVASCFVPSEATVRSEFLSRYPDSEIKNTDLIFEQDDVVLYLVKAREKGSSADGTYDFALKRRSGTWKWCDDNTERKCK